MLTLQKKIVGLILLLSMSANTLAHNDASKASSKLQSNAIEFARQAGSIAGIASACGQNLDDFSARITEAFNKLAYDSADKTAAALVYQRIRQEAQIAEKKNQMIPCPKVLHDFRNLPIMQADYKTNVIDQLNPTSPEKK